jgi:hypothetical protein
MSTENLITLITAGLAFLASIIAIIVSAYNARFVRFASEKWWERKAEAYTHIIDALSDMVYYNKVTYKAEIEGAQINKTRKMEIQDQWKQGNLAVRKATNIGAFLISPEAENALKQYWNQSEEQHDPGDWMWELEHDYSSAKKCLEEIVQCAKNDLGLKRLNRHKS